MPSTARGEPRASEHRPRVLFLITLAEVGGAGTYAAALLPALARSFEVTVAAYGPGPLRDAAHREGVRFVPLRHVRRPISIWRDLLGLIELVRLFRRERPDIVHANSSKAGILGRIAAVLARVPIRIFTVHGWAYSVVAGPMANVYLWLERLVGPTTTLVICVSETDRALGVRRRTCRPDRSAVIYNGIDVRAVPRATFDSAVATLVSVGRLQAPQKDFITLVRALALVRSGQFRALLVGDGPDRDKLKAEIRRLGLEASVSLLGERDDVPDLLARSDVFVLATTYESLPLSIIEAMAAGLPVVASAVGGVPELVVDGETGILVPPRDPEALAAALAALVTDRERCRTMGAAARARAETTFDLAAFQHAHVEAYERLLAERGLH